MDMQLYLDLILVSRTNIESSQCVVTQLPTILSQRTT